jgi:hypothetical protein
MPMPQRSLLSPPAATWCHIPDAHNLHETGMLTTTLLNMTDRSRLYKQHRRHQTFKRNHFQPATAKCLPVSWDRKTLRWAQQRKTLGPHDLETPNIIHGRKFWYGTAYRLYEIKVTPLRTQRSLTWMLAQGIPGQGRATWNFCSL